MLLPVAIHSTRCAPPLLSLVDDAAVDFDLGSAIQTTAKAVTSALPKDLPDLVDLNNLSGELADLFSALSLQLQIVGTSVLGVAFLIGVFAGQVFGDRSSPSEAFMELQDANTYRTELSEAATEAWDRGETDLASIGTSRNSRFAKAQEADEAAARSSIFGQASKDLARPVSAGLWLELFLCVLLDAAGNASLFAPGVGELTDFVGASAIAYILTLFFEWPALATFAFWEEVTLRAKHGAKHAARACRERGVCHC